VALRKRAWHELQCGGGRRALLEHVDDLVVDGGAFTVMGGGGEQEGEAVLCHQVEHGLFGREQRRERTCTVGGEGGRVGEPRQELEESGDVDLHHAFAGGRTRWGWAGWTSM
jgi:hypothetical protein